MSGAQKGHFCASFCCKPRALDGKDNPPQEDYVQGHKKIMSAELLTLVTGLFDFTRKGKIVTKSSFQATKFFVSYCTHLGKLAKAMGIVVTH